MKLALALLFTTYICLAQVIIKPEQYNFPKIEPLKAAVSTTFIGTPNGRWLQFKMGLQNRRIRNLRDDERIKVRYLWPDPSKDRGELVYILAGFGGRATDPKSNFFARKLADNGFHAIILPSIFTREFVVAISSAGIVGEFSRDAWDYFNLMKEATKYVTKYRGVTFSKKHMIGYSYGALTAAFVAKIDKRQNFFNLDKEVLINPPTDLIGAADTLDHFSSERDKMGAYTFTKLLLRVGLISYYYRRYIPTVPTYQSYLSKIPMTLPQAKAMVGTGLRSALPEVKKAVYASLIHDHGNLMGIKPTGSETFHDFLKNVLLPFNRSNYDPEDTLEEINKRNALYSLKDYFENNSNVFLIHNKDDFLIHDGDLEFFSKSFGDRFVLYPWGGHMGNLWHPQNVKGLVTLLKGSPVWME